MAAIRCRALCSGCGRWDAHYGGLCCVVMKCCPVTHTVESSQVAQDTAACHMSSYTVGRQCVPTDPRLAYMPGQAAQTSRLCRATRQDQGTPAAEATTFVGGAAPRRLLTAPSPAQQQQFSYIQKCLLHLPAAVDRQRLCVPCSLGPTKGHDLGCHVASMSPLMKIIKLKQIEKRSPCCATSFCLPACCRDHYYHYSVSRPAAGLLLGHTANTADGSVSHWHRVPLVPPAVGPRTFQRARHALPCLQAYQATPPIYTHQRPSLNMPTIS